MRTRGDLGPVLKWAGGKRQLLPHILARFPRPIPTYFEPFIGGGAVFFALAAERAFERAVIADRNPELVNVYRALQRDVEGVIRRLEEYALAHSEEQYYLVRAAKPRSPAARAARFIYLNKTGFNGLYRVNRQGQFNVPLGRYKKPSIVDGARLRAAASVLAEVEILESDFEAVCGRARKGDAVYLDPPYLPVSRTAHFAEYHAEPFGLDEHRRLAKAFAKLEARGVCALLSNSDTSDTRALFGRFRLDQVAARRSINSNSRLRGPVAEILVSTRAVVSPPEA